MALRPKNAKPTARTRWGGTSRAGFLGPPSTARDAACWRCASTAPAGAPPSSPSTGCSPFMPSVRRAPSRGRRPAEAQPWKGLKRSPRPTAFEMRSSHLAPAARARGGPDNCGGGRAGHCGVSAAAPLASARYVPAAPPSTSRGNRTVSPVIPTCPLGDKTPHSPQG